MGPASAYTAGNPSPPAGCDVHNVHVEYSVSRGASSHVTEGSSAVTVSSYVVAGTSAPAGWSWVRFEGHV